MAVSNCRDLAAAESARGMVFRARPFRELENGDFLLRARGASVSDMVEPPELETNNPQQSWGFEGEPPKAVMKDYGIRIGAS